MEERLREEKGPRRIEGRGKTRIAVVRLDKIGDLILTTPAIASLKNANPECHLTAIVSPYNKVVLTHSPDVDEIWEWEWTGDNISQLRQSRFDRIAVFSPTTPSYLVALVSGAKVRAGYVYHSRILTRLFSAFCLNRRLICPIDQKDILDNRISVPHEVEQNLAVVSALGVKKSDMRPHLVVPVLREDLEWARQKLNGKPSTGIHLSRAWISDLGPDFLLRLLARLSGEIQVFVTYGVAEAAWASSLSLPEGIRRFGALSFSQWSALYHEARSVVSTNTGALHLAASQGVPVVAVLDPAFFAYHEKRWAPWEVPSLILRKDDPNLLPKIIKGALNLANAKENIGSNLQS